MSRILIIVDSYLPMFAPRMGYLSRHLIEEGWSINVVTTEIWGCKPIYDIDGVTANVVRVDASKYLSEDMPQWKRQWERLTKKDGEMHRLTKAMYEESCKMLSESKHDVIIASAAYTPVLARIARKCSEKFKIPWIADFRDLHEQHSPILKTDSLRFKYRNFWKKKLIRRRNKIIKSASALTCVSIEHEQVLSKYHYNVKCIYNGYDKDLYFYKNAQKTEKYSIIYGGKVYQDLRFQDPTFLLQAVAELHQEGGIDKENFVLDFYLDEADKKYIRELAIRYSILDYVVLNDLVEVAQFSKNLASSSICLLLTSSISLGVLPTKLYEFMGSRRPVLVIPDDKGAVSRIVNSCGAGCCATDTQMVKEYIKATYLAWKNTGKVECDSDHDAIVQYTRQNQSKLFYDIILEVILEYPKN